MKFKSLSHHPIELIAECFIACFQDYFVPMPEDKAYYIQRWSDARIDFNRSFGVYDSDRLIGCLLTVIRKKDDLLTAYNAGTGIHPDYRGQRLAQKLYKKAIGAFKKSGITRCELEVIQENKAAILLYEKLGFTICNNLRCYSGDLPKSTQQIASITHVTFEEITKYAHVYDHQYAWDNRLSSIALDNAYSYYTVDRNNKVIAYFIIKTESGYVAQLELIDDHLAYWDALFSAISTINTQIKVNNVPVARTDKLSGIESTGLTNVVNQYQMELFI